MTSICYRKGIGETLDSRAPKEYPLARECEVQSQCREDYDERLKLGVAREQADKDLPLSAYTEAYWKVGLLSLFHFLDLVLRGKAALEIRIYAKAIAEVIKSLVPMTWEAFEDYCLNALTLSYQEQQEIRRLLHPEWSFRHAALTGGELSEFNAKLKWLGFRPPPSAGKGWANAIGPAKIHLAVSGEARDIV